MELKHFLIGALVPFANTLRCVRGELEKISGNGGGRLMARPSRLTSGGLS